MKTLTCILLTVTILVSHIYGYLIQVPTAPVPQPRITVPAQSQWVRLQKFIIPLFENVCDVNSSPVIRALAEGFKMDPIDFMEPDVIKNLKDLIASGLLPKGEIFTEYKSEHMRELKIIHEVLINAKNFEIFYQAAAWMRENVNCALYVNAIYMAIQMRNDTNRLSIPAPYELLPNYFIRKDVIQIASSLITGQKITPTESIRNEGNGYVIDANYTAIFYDSDEDSKLAYFREDIGLNSYYFLRKLTLLPWFNEDINGDYGERMYQMMKQFMARYDLERYANGFSELDSINWDLVPNIPYDPMLIYSNGNEFSYRMSTVQIPVNEGLELLKTIENNIENIVTHMRQSGYSKPQILNHLMEILVTGDRSYETLARQFFGRDLTNNGYASVLEHYMTSLRDPIFWKINKKIVELVDNALKLILPSYSRSELYFPGVQVVNIEVKKLMTAYDYFEFDVTDALKIGDTNSTFNIKIGQPRLNHKPFTIKINVSSLVSQRGLLKIYLGPKLMPGELATKKNLFTLLDTFEVNLKLGTNIITRTSGQMEQYADDFMSLPIIRNKIEDAEFGLDSLPLKTISSQTAYPSRLILPKGSPEGLPLQIFVFVGSYVKESVSDSYSSNIMEFNSAILSPGYPLDLLIDDSLLFQLPNALMKQIMITQKADSKVENYGGPGVTKKWYGAYDNIYDTSSRPNYSGKEPFDYKAKKGTYGKGEVYEKPKDYEYNVAYKDIISNKDIKDDLTVIPRALSSTKFDYSSTLKDKESNDYKSKQIQINKMDDLDENEVNNKYRTVSIEEITSVPSIDSIDSDEKNISTKKIQIEEGNKNDNIIKPRFLGPAKYNALDSSNVQGEEPFNYKTNKQLFDKKYYINKRKETYKPVATDDEFPIPSGNKDSIYGETMNALEDIVADNKSNENKGNSFIPHLLGSPLKPLKEKAKKTELNKKSYTSKKDDYSKYGTKPSVETTTSSSTKIDSSDDKVGKIIIINKEDNLGTKISEKKIRILDNNKMMDEDDENSDSIEESEPLPPVVITKRTPTLYEFLIGGFDYEDDSSDSKIYV